MVSTNQTDQRSVACVQKVVTGLAVEQKLALTFQLLADKKLETRPMLLMQCWQSMQFC